MTLDPGPPQGLELFISCLTLAQYSVCYITLHLDVYLGVVNNAVSSLDCPTQTNRHCTPARGHALPSCLRMNRRLVYQFCCCFGDAFISRFKECLNMKCLEIRKKSNLKEKYYQSMKKNMHLLFIQGACLKFS